MPIGLSTMVKQTKDQVSCSLNDEVALLNLKTSLYFGIDEVGACVWQTLTEPKPVAELCRQILDRFDVEKAQCEADLLEFLTQLEHAGLIEIVAPAPPPADDRE